MDDESFFSINRLVEFGMGVAIAQQMVRTMNESINTMQIPGSMNLLTDKLQVHIICNNFNKWLKMGSC